MVSDERDIDEDLDEEIVFREPIVGGLPLFSLAGRRSPRPTRSMLLSSNWKGSGVVNVLTSDVTRDPASWS